jgi:hypothetical protein
VVEITGPTSSNVGRAALVSRVSKSIVSNNVRGTALFSFEGMNLDAILTDHLGVNLGDSFMYRQRISVSLIFENCIEKNFHVPNMKSGPCEEHGCNFKRSKFDDVRTSNRAYVCL